MNGVEILVTTEVPVEFTFNEWAFWITGGIVLIAFVCRGLHAWLLEDCTFSVVPTLVVVGILVGFFLGACAGGLLFSTPLVYEAQYKVIIDDSVLMAEFLDNYEILDQEGKIYTVKERIPEELINER